MGAVILWIGRLLLSFRAWLIPFLATFFSWVMKSKVFWCFIALYGIIRGSLAAYRYIINYVLQEVGGFDITAPSGSLGVFSMANSVVPIDEIGAAFVMIGSAYALRFSLRWVRTAYGLVPFKAT